jgi:hypothetical protein
VETPPRPSDRPVLIDDPSTDPLLVDEPPTSLLVGDPLETGRLRRLDGPSLEATAAVLAARCARAVATIAEVGGPGAAVHLEELRRLLLRREPRAPRGRRRQIERAIIAAGAGRPGAIAPDDRVALVRDLRDIDRALGSALRIGAGRPLLPGGSASGVAAEDAAEGSAQSGWWT